MGPQQYSLLQVFFSCFVANSGREGEDEQLTGLAESDQDLPHPVLVAESESMARNGLRLVDSLPSTAVDPQGSCFSPHGDRELRAESTLREVVDLMRPVADEKGIRLHARFGGDMPKIPLDREKLKQVLINLVRNAIEAMTEGGDLTVSTAREGGSIAIRVADTGPGIDKKVDPFDLFVTTKADGTGLGLPIARRIVEAHGGSLACSSVPGRGATFTVTLKGN